MTTKHVPELSGKITDPNKLLLKHKIEFFSKLKDLMQEYSVESFSAEEEHLGGYDGYRVSGVEFHFSWLFENSKRDLYRQGDYMLLRVNNHVKDLEAVVNQLQKEFDKS